MREKEQRETAFTPKEKRQPAPMPDESGLSWRSRLLLIGYSVPLRPAAWQTRSLKRLTFV